MAPGTILREAWALYSAHFRHLVSVAFVVYLLITALTVALVFLIGVLAALATLTGVFWLQGVLVKAVEDVRDGRADLSLRATLESALPRINVLSATGLLATLAVGVGLGLFVIPGLVLLTLWSLIVPAIMLEHAGVFRAFGRSRKLVRGNGWSVFAVIVITVALLIGAGVVLSLLVVPVDSPWIRNLIVGVLANSLMAPYVAVAWTLMYYELRDRAPAA